jgi:4-hydroxy-tetrahydrodipicolinate reductase
MPNRLRVVVSGATGRMGRSVAELIEADDTMELLGGIGRTSYELGWAATVGFPAIESPEESEWLLHDADALIDFSSPELFRRLVAAQSEHMAHCALVVGTTGLEAEDIDALRELSRNGPVLPAPNFSIGVNLLVALAEQTARVLGSEFDVEIVETHHRRKLDAPSGTALQLGRAVAAGRGLDLEDVRRDGRRGRLEERDPREIGFHAVRGGDVVGEHRVMYIGEYERIELGHVAATRSLFAEGALRAARWLAGRPAGLYTMRHVLGLAAALS